METKIPLVYRSVNVYKKCPTLFNDWGLYYYFEKFLILYSTETLQKPIRLCKCRPTLTYIVYLFGWSVGRPMTTSSWDPIFRDLFHSLSFFQRLLPYERNPGHTTMCRIRPVLRDYPTRVGVVWGEGPPTSSFLLRFDFGKWMKCLNGPCPDGLTY